MTNVNVYNHTVDMKISSNFDSMTTTITDSDMVQWLDGISLYYKLPKDQRPDDFNPYDGDDLAMQTYWLLEKLTSRKTSETLNKELDTLKELATIYDRYANHVLGLIIREEYDVV